MHAFLIDECLSPKLAEFARTRGFDASHVNWLARRGAPDHSLLRIVGDRIFVTNNAVDFRRLYAALDIHPGLVIILPSVDGPEQTALFEAVLDRVATLADCINTLIVIDRAGVITITDFPSS